MDPDDQGPSPYFSASSGFGPFGCRTSTGRVDGGWSRSLYSQHCSALVELDSIICEKIHCFGWIDYCNQVRILCWIFVLGDQTKLDQWALAHVWRRHLCAYKPLGELAFAER